MQGCKDVRMPYILASMCVLVCHDRISVCTSMNRDMKHIIISNLRLFSTEGNEV